MNRTERTRIDPARVRPYRRQVQAFLRLLEPGALEMWREMPNKWTPAGVLCARGKLSTESMRLARLLEVGAVERLRDGKNILYRPKPFVEFRMAVAR